jgi:hypothetical protein
MLCAYPVWQLDPGKNVYLSHNSESVLIALEAAHDYIRFGDGPMPLPARGQRIVVVSSRLPRPHFLAALIFVSTAFNVVLGLFNGDPSSGITLVFENPRDGDWL